MENIVPSIHIHSVKMRRETRRQVATVVEGIDPMLEVGVGSQRAAFLHSWPP